MNPSDSDFTDNYSLNTHADASSIPLLVGAPSLTPTDTVNIQGEQVEIKDLYHFRSNFTTFISMAGGVDRVTGSNFADVIVGPSHMAPHGRLTVNAGAGDDILPPDRISISSNGSRYVSLPLPQFLVWHNCKYDRCIDW